ncbi:hypothetical protein F4860DRAFT_82316 [Xylaria cubensis]|nr:hypothetical protein F4860DRAFT_82316 [Xylaria cubensis]
MAAIFTSAWVALEEAWSTTVGKVLAVVLLVAYYAVQYLWQKSRATEEKRKQEALAKEKYKKELSFQKTLNCQVFANIIAYSQNTPSSNAPHNPPSPPIEPPSGFGAWLENLSPTKPPAAVLRPSTTMASDILASSSSALLNQDY